MNDRFKFRVWTGHHYAEDFRFIMSMNGDLKQGTYVSGFDKPYQDCVVEQCTGLKDKNGNLIYEGDIVKGIATVDEGGFEYCGVVEWNDQSELIGWYIVDADGNGWELKQAHAKISSDNITGEIIGNIHEQKDAA